MLVFFFLFSSSWLVSYSCTFTPRFFCRITLWCVSLLLLVTYYSVTHACFFFSCLIFPRPSKQGVRPYVHFRHVMLNGTQTRIRACTSRFTLWSEGQRSTNAGHQIARMAKLYTTSPYLCGASSAESTVWRCVVWYKFNYISTPLLPPSWYKILLPWRLREHLPPKRL